MRFPNATLALAAALSLLAFAAAAQFRGGRPMPPPVGGGGGVHLPPQKMPDLNGGAGKTTTPPTVIVGGSTTGQTAPVNTGGGEQTASQGSAGEVVNEVRGEEPNPTDVDAQIDSILSKAALFDDLPAVRKARKLREGR